MIARSVPAFHLDLGLLNLYPRWTITLFPFQALKFLLQCGRKVDTVGWPWIELRTSNSLILSLSSSWATSSPLGPSRSEACSRTLSGGAIPFAWSIASTCFSYPCFNWKGNDAPSGRYLKTNVQMWRTWLDLTCRFLRVTTSLPRLNTYFIVSYCRLWRHLTNLTRCPIAFLERSWTLSDSGKLGIRVGWVDLPMIATSYITNLISPSSGDVGMLKYLSSSEEFRWNILSSSYNNRYQSVRASKTWTVEQSCLKCE